MNSTHKTPEELLKELEDLKQENESLRLLYGQYAAEWERAEAALLEVSRYSRNLLESSVDPLVTISSEGKITDANAATEKVTGVPRDVLIGSDFSNYFTDPEKASTGYQEVFTNGFVKDYPLSILHQNGTITDVLYNASVYKNDDGSVAGVFAAARDITERKRAEEALRKVSHYSRNLIESSLDPLVTISSVGKITDVNAATETVTGISRYELIGSDFSNYFTDPEKAQEGYQAVFTYGYVKDYPLSIKHKNGKITDVLYNASIYLGEDGSVAGVFAAARDITERKRTEETLKQVSTTLELATRAGGVGIFDYNLVNNTLIWDDQMFRLYGVNKADFSSVYEAWQSSVHPEDLARSENEIQLAISGAKEFDTEFRIVWADGSIHNIRALAEVQHDENGTPLRLIGTNWDMTPQKKAEEELRNYLAQIELKNAELDKALAAAREATALANEMAAHAEVANKSKSIFLSNMSHEIRTPLNAIIGFSQLMNRDAMLTESQKEYNISIIRAGEHLLKLINDILELSKIEAGRVVLNPANIDLYALIEDIQLIFKERIESKHLQSIFEICPYLPKYVVVDENKLRQIFVNLIGNAVKFTEEGGIAVRVRVNKNLTASSRLVVEIQDSGPGIPENELTELFKHFSQTTSGIKKGSGTGLGLVLSRELAILMGGNITASSIVGQGSVFTFEIDIIEGKLEAVESNITKRVVRLHDDEKPYLILVVDDKEENLKVAVNLLKIVGFTIEEAVNGVEAIAKFEECSPDLILMDLRMPVMDGYEATRRIKATAKGKQTPIVALTASAFEDEQENTKMLGMQGYIRKPFRENELFGTIQKVLGVKYVYEGETPSVLSKYHNNAASIEEDITQLPVELVSAMKESAAIADISQLELLISEIEKTNVELAQYLFTLANNYDYDFIQQILSKTDTDHEQ